MLIIYLIIFLGSFASSTTVIGRSSSYYAHRWTSWNRVKWKIEIIIFPNVYWYQKVSDTKNSFKVIVTDTFCINFHPISGFRNWILILKYQVVYLIGSFLSTSIFIDFRPRFLSYKMAGYDVQIFYFIYPDLISCFNFK